jgi:HNH endonuclease
MSFSDDLRMRVKDKANFTCCWCRDQEKKVEIHHITPQADGGPDTEDNAAPLCSNCHTAYGGNPEMRKEIRGRRDNWYKICNKEHALVSQADIQAILQYVKTRDPGITAEVQATRPKQDTNWKLVYELSLPAHPLNQRDRNH